MKTLTEHWNKIFKKTDENKLGWYEEDFSQTLKFLNIIPQWESLNMKFTTSWVAFPARI